MLIKQWNECITVYNTDHEALLQTAAHDLCEKGKLRYSWILKSNSTISIRHTVLTRSPLAVMLQQRECIFTRTWHLSFIYSWFLSQLLPLEPSTFFYWHLCNREPRNTAKRMRAAMRSTSRGSCTWEADGETGFDPFEEWRWQSQFREARVEEDGGGLGALRCPLQGVHADWTSLIVKAFEEGTRR